MHFLFYILNGHSEYHKEIKKKEKVRGRETRGGKGREVEGSRENKDRERKLRR